MGLCAGIAAACLGYLLRGRLGLALLSVPVLIGLPFGVPDCRKLIGLRLGRIRFTRACKQLLSRVTVTA